jgi:hypothetical protein
LGKVIKGMSLSVANLSNCCLVLLAKKLAMALCVDLAYKALSFLTKMPAAWHNDFAKCGSNAATATRPFLQAYML